MPRKAVVKQPPRKDKQRKKGVGNWRDTWSQFVEQARQLGLKLRDVNGDGNCLFRAIADQLSVSSVPIIICRRWLSFMACFVVGGGGTQGG